MCLIVVFQIWSEQLYLLLFALFCFGNFHISFFYDLVKLYIQEYYYEHNQVLFAH